MKRLTAIALCFAMPMATFGASEGHKVEYEGGSLPDLKAGANLRIRVDQQNIHLVRDKKDVAVIPSGAVTELSYGQDVHRRIGAAIGIGVFTLGLGALMAFAKSKKHFIGVTWDDAGKRGGFAFQANKDDYRGLLTGLEGVTGKKAINTNTMSVKN